MKHSHMKSNRRGVQLLEAGVALAVAAVCIGLSATLFSTMLQTGRLLGVREAALREADNLLEQVESVPFDALDSLQIGDLTADNRLLTIAEVAEISVDVTDPNRTSDESEPQCRQIVVTVRFRDDKDRPARPIRLVGWRFAAARPDN